MLRCWVLLACLLSLGGRSFAQAPTGSETAARAHYERGAALFDDARYVDAILEFEAARALHRVAAFEYNIGRCHERLEQWTLAADAFERYLRIDPKAQDAAGIVTRIAELRERASSSGRRLERLLAAPLAKAPRPAVVLIASPPTTPTRRLGPATVGVGIAALVFASIGSGLIASVSSAYPGREALCRTRACSVDDLRGQLHGGYATLALAGVATVVDVALIVAWSRQRKSVTR